MPAVSRFPIEILSQFEKRDYAEDKGVDDNDGESPVAILGLVVASLTLLVAVMSLGSPRFRRWVFGLFPSQFVKKLLGITPPNHLTTTVTTTEDVRAIPVVGIPVPGPVIIYNNYSNTQPARSHPNTPPYGPSGINGEGSRAPQVEESLGPRRPEPVVPGGSHNGRHFASV